MRPAVTAAAALFVLTVSAGCSPSEPGAGRPGATTKAPRPAQYETCRPSGIAAPEGMVLIDRQLPNVGDGTLGRLEVYDGDASRLEITVGVDVLDAYEDLDFEAEPVVVAGRPALLSRAGAFGTTDRLVVLTWRDAEVPGPCRDVALVGTNMSPTSLLALAHGRRGSVPSPEGS